jgi:hypothetical protein
MKKLLTMTSVLLAGFFGTAQADVTVSGSAGLSVTSVGDATNITNSGGVAFGLSTTLENGMTISSSGLSLGIDGDSLADATIDDTDAFYNLTFSSGGTSLTIGADVENDFADLGVGGVAGDAVSIGLGAGTSVLTTGDDVGAGFALSTSLGGASVKLGYIYDDENATNAADFGGNGLDTATALQVSLPIGPLSATVGYQDNDDAADGVTMTGASVAYAVAGGTVKVAYVSADSVAANTDAVQTSGSYSTTLADGTSVSVGYSSTDEDAVAVTTDFEVSVSRSIGTGASMFIDFHNRDSVAAGTESSAVAIGTSVSF